MRAFEPAELWITRVAPMKIVVGTGKVVDPGSRRDRLIKRYRWKWVAELQKGFVRGKDGTLLFFKVREVQSVGTN